VTNPNRAADETDGDREHRPSYGVMIAYGVGDLAQAAMIIGFQMLLLFYYQQIVGVSGPYLTSLSGILGFLSDPRHPYSR